METEERELKSTILQKHTIENLKISSHIKLKYMIGHEPDEQNTKIFYNSISTAFYQVIVMIAGFITPKLCLSIMDQRLMALFLLLINS